MSFVSLNCGSIHADEKFLTALVALKLDTTKGVFEYSGKGYQRSHAGHDNFHIVEEVDAVRYDLYLKRHTGFEVKETIKLFATRSPLVSAARREWNNILTLEGIGVHTMRPVAYGEVRFGCFEVKSFIITERMPRATPLDDYIRAHFGGRLDAATLREKRALLWDLGDLARRLHTAGFTHMDLYLNHVFVRETEAGDRVLHLIDLQRVARRWLLKRRWIVKDLAAIIYSARGLGLSRTDFCRIFRAYLDGGHSIRDHGLIKAAAERAERMAARNTASAKS